MRKKIKVCIGAAALGVATLVGTGVAIAGSNDDDATERPITGEARAKAEAAALQFTSGGRVTGTEVGDEESLYEVEVTKPDGSVVDVQLDPDFKVVGDKPDDDTAADN